MRPTALRLLAIPLSLITFALNAARAKWFDPITYDMGVRWGLAADMAGSIVAMLPAIGFLALCYRRPREFQPEPGRWVAPADPGWAAMGILWMGIAGGYPFTAGHLVSGLILAWLSVVVATAFIAVNRPRLDLDPEGLTLRHIRTVQRVEWDRLVPGGPLPPTRRRPRDMYVLLKDAPVSGLFRPSLRIPTRLLHIDSTYLAERIRFYVENPDARSEIGAGAREAAPPGGGKPRGAPSI